MPRTHAPEAFQARGTWPSLKQPIPSHYSKSCRLDSLRDMSLAFGVSHLPGGHKPSRPASLGYRLPLSIVAGIWQASSTEARHTHHVRLRNPRSNAELYQKGLAYAPNLQFPSRLHRNNSNRVREACRGQHGARIVFYGSWRTFWKLPACAGGEWFTQTAWDPKSLVVGDVAGHPEEALSAGHDSCVRIGFFSSSCRRWPSLHRSRAWGPQGCSNGSELWRYSPHLQGRSPHQPFGRPDRVGQR